MEAEGSSPSILTTFHMEGRMSKLKQCKICGKEKDYDTEFAKNGKSTRVYCKECEASRAREKYYQTQEFLRSLKTKCSRCGYDRNPSALDFHHPDKNKDAEIAVLAKRYLSTKQKEKLLVEIEKCELLCANCHREEHHKEYNRY